MQKKRTKNRPPPARTAKPQARQTDRQSDRPQGRSEKPRRDTGPGPTMARDSVLFYGRHAVAAALRNPARQLRRLWATEKALAGITGNRPQPDAVSIVTPDALDRFVEPGTNHQGLVAELSPLPGIALETFLAAADARTTVLMLDQVTDPQNVGAIIRSAAAFGAAAIITQDRNSPPETGALAKAASGCLELLPWIRVTNIARALDLLADAGFWRYGLDGSATGSIEALDVADRAVLVLGAEGRGLRPATAKACDLIVSLPISPRVESLNVSNAAAVALFALQRS